MNKEKPLVSVLMCCYREPENYLELAIESILNQTYENLELLLVVDDPRNRMAWQIVRNYSSADNRIVPIFNEENIGLTSSLNKAIHYAKGEYFCRMDSDDISNKERIEEQLSYLLANRLDLVGSFLDVIGEFRRNHDLSRRHCGTTTVFRILLGLAKLPFSRAGIGKFHTRKTMIF